MADDRMTADWPIVAGTLGGWLAGYNRRGWWAFDPPVRSATRDGRPALRFTFVRVVPRAA